MDFTYKNEDRQSNFDRWPDLEGIITFAITFLMAFDASKYVQYLEDWQVLICLHEKCKYCLTPNGMELHFQRYHNDIYDLHTRQQIVRHAATLRLCQPSDIVIPTNMPPSIKGLRLWKNGWQCKERFKVGYAVGGAKQHCESIHLHTSHSISTSTSTLHTPPPSPILHLRPGVSILIVIE